MTISTTPEGTNVAKKLAIPKKGTKRSKSGDGTIGTLTEASQTEIITLEIIKVIGNPGIVVEKLAGTSLKLIQRPGYIEGRQRHMKVRQH